MPVYTAEFEYRVVAGWVSKATLEGSDAYRLENFGLASDQVSRFIYPWMCSDESFYPDYVRSGQYADEVSWVDGAITFFWVIPYMTEGMVSLWEGTIYGGLGMYPDSATQFAPVTTKTRKHNGEFGVYQGYFNRARPNVDYRRSVRGVEGYKQAFVDGTEIFS